MKNILVVSPRLDLMGGTEKQVTAVYNRLSVDNDCSVIESKWSFKVFSCSELHVWRADALLIMLVARLLGKRSIYMIRDSTPFKHQKMRWILMKVATIIATDVLSNSFAGLGNLNVLRKGKVIVND